VHEGDAHGQHHLVVHRHLQPHGVTGHHAPHRTEVEDPDDDPVVTLTTVFTVSPIASLVTPPRVASELIEPPPLNRCERPCADVDTLIHGPPRAPTPSRAPPSLPVI
jgi:hypothetical protein